MLFIKPLYKTNITFAIVQIMWEKQQDDDSSGCVKDSCALFLSLVVNILFSIKRCCNH